MNFLKSFLCVSFVGFVALVSSCAKIQTESYNEFESKALEAWITQHRKDLINNKQEVGGYYVDVLQVGSVDPDMKPVSDTACWVQFEFTGRSLGGNVALTRSAEIAVFEDTFTKYTRYVPFYRFCGTQNTGLVDGTYLAMRNTLKLGKEYAAQHGFPETLNLRVGSEVDLYMPSSVVGSGGLEGNGGYEGQYALSANRPMIVRMKVVGVVKNPLEREGDDADTYCKDNGGLKVYSKKTDDKEGEPLPTDPNDKNHPYKVAERWVSVSDSIPQLYVNYRYTPEETLTFKNPYVAKHGVYYDAGSVAKINGDIAAALKARFHKDEAYKGIPALGADSVGLDGSAKIWYIGRFLDGFIFDTNIDEVKKIIYGEVTSSGTALSYKPSEGGLIQAFYYTIPHMQFGQWGALITTSTYAYGASGKTGSSSSSTSGGTSDNSYLDYINYMNYQNSYYGNNYMGGYYGDYYGGGYGGGYGNNYMGGYYGSNYGSGYDNSTTGQTVTTTTVSTEIPAYAPLIFQFFIEPKED